MDDDLAARLPSEMSQGVPLSTIPIPAPSETLRALPLDA